MNSSLVDPMMENVVLVLHCLQKSLTPALNLLCSQSATSMKRRVSKKGNRKQSKAGFLWSSYNRALVGTVIFRIGHLHLPTQTWEIEKQNHPWNAALEPLDTGGSTYS